MKLLVFSVFDSKAEIFGQPMFFPAKGLAIRAFDDECNRKESQIHAHAEDFTLFQIGEFDQDKGLLIPLTTPVSLGIGVEFKGDETE